MKKKNNLEKENLIIKGLFCFILILTMFMWLIFNVVLNNLLEKIIVNICFIILILLHFYLLYIISKKIFIINDKLYEKKLLNKKELICKLKEIKGFCENISGVIFINNEDKLFSIPFFGEENQKLIKYLKDNCKEKVIFKGNKITEIVFLYLAVLLSIGQMYYVILIFSFILIILAIKERRYMCYFKDDVIIYRNLFTKNIIKIKDIKEMTYKRNYGFSRYKPFQKNYKIILKSEKKKIVMNYVLENVFNNIKDIAKDNKIKIIKK